MKNRTRIIFRADGNSQIGLGHVVRSLALAEMLYEEFECIFAIQEPSETLVSQIRNTGVEIIKLPALGTNAENFRVELGPYLQGNEIVVLDGYNFDTAYQQFVKSNCFKLVCIDDIYKYHFVADAIINHIEGIKPESYSAEPYTKFYLGFRYALLRKEFRDAAKFKKYSTEPLNNAVLICLGGADPQNDTLEILKTCLETDKKFRYYVVVGGAYKFTPELNAFAAQQLLDLTVLTNISSAEMVACMQRCSRAIMSPSSVSYEYLSAGNGILYLKKTAENQTEVYNYFIANFMALPFEQFAAPLPESTKQKLLANSQVFDGKQQQTFLAIFKNLINENV